MQVRSSEKQIQMLKSMVQRIHIQQSESIEDDLHSDLQEVMISHNDEISKVYSEGTFARLFGMNSGRLHCLKPSDGTL